MEYIQVLESLEDELKQAFNSYIRMFGKAIEKTLGKSKDILEKKLIESFVMGCMDELAHELNKNLSLDQGNSELEEDIIVIANQLGRIDVLLHRVGITQANFADLCSVALEKWFMNYTKKSRQFASQIVRQETWQVSKEHVNYKKTSFI